MLDLQPGDQIHAVWPKDQGIYGRVLDRTRKALPPGSVMHRRPGVHNWHDCTNDVETVDRLRYPETDDVRVRVRVRLRDGRTVVVHETESWSHGCVGSVEAVEPAPTGAPS